MHFINITPVNLIGKVGNTMEMALTHLMLSNEAYSDAMGEVTVPVLLDNSYFELGYSLPPKDIIKAARMLKKAKCVYLVCPDGTRDGQKEFIKAGFKCMCIPKTVEQFHEFMEDPTVHLVGVSEEHFERRHAIGARYNLFKDHMPALASKKIHLLGGTDSMWELALLSPFKNYIHSWDTSMPVWQGQLGHKIDRQVSKDTTSVDFNQYVAPRNPIVLHNLQWVKSLVEEYYEG